MKVYTKYQTKPKEYIMRAVCKKCDSWVYFEDKDKKKTIDRLFVDFKVYKKKGKATIKFYIECPVCGYKK